MADPTVCHIPPVQPKTQPDSNRLPSIPLATPDLASVTASVNAMRQIVMLLAGQQGNQGPQRKPDKSQPGRWKERSRIEKTVRVFQNDDKNSPNWVDVKQINQLTMADSVTGETWVWSR